MAGPRKRDRPPAVKLGHRDYYLWDLASFHQRRPHGRVSALDIGRHLKVGGLAVGVLDPYVDHAVTAAIVLDVATFSAHSPADAPCAQLYVSHWPSLCPSPLAPP